jgi:NADH dehydrogenase [ubiquinone] 1 alpha subcomplex assembly factor 1
MKYLPFILLFFSTSSAYVIFDFNKDADVSNWVIVDDIVMGGKSSSAFTLNKSGYGVFEGSVSLENNGGFSSVRHRFQKIMIKNYTKIHLKVKGDGKDYQFRIKSSAKDYYSYTAQFSTSGEWQEIEIDLNNMHPTFRGRKLNKPNFNKSYIEEIAFLIGNKKKENFKLLIDKIELK